MGSESSSNSKHLILWNKASKKKLIQRIRYFSIVILQIKIGRKSIKSFLNSSDSLERLPGNSQSGLSYYNETFVSPTSTQPEKKQNKTLLGSLASFLLLEARGEGSNQ